MSNPYEELERRSSRGTRRGADDVWAHANTVTVGSSAATFLGGKPWFAFAGGLTAVLAVGIGISLLSGGQGPVERFPPATTPSGKTCVEPPVGEISRTMEERVFLFQLTPGQVTAGGRARIGWDLSAEGDRFVPLTRVASYWQCWDGEGWVDIYVLIKSDGSSRPPGVLPVGSAVDLAARVMPLGAEILIPEVAPGTYRIVERIDTNEGDIADSMIVQVVANPTLMPPASTPIVVEPEPSTTAPTRTPPTDSCPTELRGSEIEVDEAEFPIRLSTTRGRRGGLMELTIERPEDSAEEHVTGPAVVWQCWNGDQWVDTHMLHLGLRIGQGQFQASGIKGTNDEWWVEAVGLRTPLEARMQVPFVDPGIYRIVTTISGYGDEPGSNTPSLSSFALVAVADTTLITEELHEEGNVVVIDHGLTLERAPTMTYSCPMWAFPGRDVWRLDIDEEGRVSGIHCHRIPD